MVRGFERPARETEARGGVHLRRLLLLRAPHDPRRHVASSLRRRPSGAPRRGPRGGRAARLRGGGGGSDRPPRRPPLAPRPSPRRRRAPREPRRGPERRRRVRRRPRRPHARRGEGHRRPQGGAEGAVRPPRSRGEGPRARPRRFRLAARHVGPRQVRPGVDRRVRRPGKARERPEAPEDVRRRRRRCHRRERFGSLEPRAPPVGRGARVAARRRFRELLGGGLVPAPSPRDGRRNGRTPPAPARGRAPRARGLLPRAARRARGRARRRRPGWFLRAAAARRSESPRRRLWRRTTVFWRIMARRGAGPRWTTRAGVGAWRART